MTTTTVQEISESPSFSEARFSDLIRGMVIDHAPRLFAVVQEYGVREDARVSGWGMAFPDRVEAVSAEGTFRMGSGTPESLLRMFDAPDVTTRLAWVDEIRAEDAESA